MIIKGTAVDLDGATRVKSQRSDKSGTTWRRFLRAQAHGMPAVGFVHVLGVTANPYGT